MIIGVQFHSVTAAWCLLAGTQRWFQNRKHRLDPCFLHCALFMFQRLPAFLCHFSGLEQPGPADGYIMIYLSSRAHTCRNSTVSRRESCCLITGDCCGATVMLVSGHQRVVKPELCEQDSTVELQYMTGGKITDELHKMISPLCEIYLTFELNVFCSVVFCNAYRNLKC